MAGISTDSVRTKITENVSNFMMNTHHMNDYNEIYNANKYLNERTILEKERLQSMYDRLNSSLLGIKQEYLLKRFDVQHLKSKTNTMYLALLLVCVFLVVTILYTDDIIGQRLVLIIISVCILFFIGMVYLISKSNSYREKTNWDMYYWGPVERKK
jgi:hypothetical protein